MKRIILAAIIFLLSIPSYAKKNEAILIHPPFNELYTCSEHYDGQFQFMGDALGADCIVQRLTGLDGRMWARAYKGNGFKNSDWYGWEKDVLAPFDGVVEKIKVNKIVNKPGIMGKDSATSVLIKRKDGMRVVVAHLRLIKVKEKDIVKAGEVIGKMGNNGFSRHPHVHIGAWKGKKAFQLRFDQRKIKPYR